MTNTNTNTNTVATREQYLALFGSTQEAIGFEDSCLQIGREFLPAQAIMVLAGAEPSPEYWQWLAEALEADDDVIEYEVRS